MPSGIKRVRQAMLAAGAKEPIFEVVANSFKVTLFPLADGVNEGVSGGVSGGVNVLLAFLADNPGKKTGEIRHALDNIPQRTLERWLKLLKAQGRIEFRGAPRTGGYFIRREG